MLSVGINDVGSPNRDLDERNVPGLNIYVDA
jgi:hypothetical protein